MAGSASSGFVWYSDDFIISERDAGYRFKGFKPADFEKAGKSIRFVGNRISGNGKNVLVRIPSDLVFSTKFGFGIIVDDTHVAFVKAWQCWGKTTNGQYHYFNLDRKYKVKEWGDFSNKLSQLTEFPTLSTFDDILSLAKEQEKEEFLFI